MKRAIDFYQSVLQITLSLLEVPSDPQNELEMWAFPADYEGIGTSGALVKFEHMPAGGNSTVVYFSCEDCAIEESRVVDSGGEIQTAKMSIGEYGFVSLVKDTEGNLIGLHSLK